MKKNNKFLILLILFLLISLSFNVQSQPNSNKKSDFDEFLFQAKVKVYMKIMDAPSVVACVIKNNSILWSGSFGYQNIYQRKKATLDSIYVIGSNSKVVTSTAILQLYEKGLIGLDDNINDYLPFQIFNPNHPDKNITLRMLLSHQSSLGDNLGDIIYYYKYLDNCSKWIKERLTIDGELYREQYWMDYEPGEKNHYSNIGFIIVSYLVEILSGQSFEDYCQENIFIPLKMFNTSFQKEKLNSAMLARPYYPLFSRIFIPMPHYDIGCVAPCGGLRTTVKDLSHFLIAHMSGGIWNGTRILKNSTVQEMHTIQYPDEILDFYGGKIQHGLGWIHINIYGSEWEGYNGGAVGSYNIKLTVTDSHGLTDYDTTTATITAPPTPPQQPPTPPTPPVQNIKPIADAGGPYYEIQGVSILFDGSDSYDPDGNTLTYKWEFGDGTTSTAEMPGHTYTKEGNYTVKLTVKDADEASDSDTTTAYISKRPNNVPARPVVFGVSYGEVNISYNFSANATDPDSGDMIQYVFDWSDGTNDTISDFLNSSEICNVSHNFSVGGIYVITVHAIDKSNAESDNQTFKVAISAHYCGSLGYLIDKDGDGTYDVFYRETTGRETNVSKENEKYFIDINGDEYWDYIYDFTTNDVSKFESSVEISSQDFKLENKWILLIVFIVTIIVFAVAKIVISRLNKPKTYKFKKKNKKEKVKKEKIKTKKDNIKEKIEKKEKGKKEKPAKLEKVKPIKIRKTIRFPRKSSAYAFNPKDKKMKKIHKDVDRLLSKKK